MKQTSQEGAVGQIHELNGIDSVITIRGYFERILIESDKVNQERDKRMDERFESQEKALTAALAAAEKAVQAALIAQKEATATALISAEKAVEKAEASQLRVNVTQNEFRGTLKDQAAGLMPRSETELLVNDLRTRIEAIGGTRREGIGLSADITLRFFAIVVSASATVAAIYFATH